MRTVPTLAFASALAISSSAVLAADLNVVTSIRPIDSIVQYVVGEHANTNVLVPANASPHNYALKPSDAKNLQQADVVFWVDETLEAFLEKAVTTLPQDARIIALGEQEGLQILDTREIALGAEGHEGEHDDHSHDEEHKDHDHEEHDHEEGHDHEEEHDHEEGHDHEEDHDHEKAHDHEEGHDDHAGHDHDGHEGHNHGEFDMHIWLSPENAEKIAHIVAHTLGDVDPANAAAYEANADKFAAELHKVTHEIEHKLEGAQGKHFVTFHDAYQYFENHFGLENAGVVTISPEVKPGAKRLVELKEALATNEVACIFSEPQFDAKLVQLAIEGTNVKSAELDPLGLALKDGPNMYFDLLNSLADSIQNCAS